MDRKVMYEQLVRKKRRTAYYGLTNFRPIVGEDLLSNFKESLSKKRRQWKVEHKKGNRAMKMMQIVNFESIPECFPSYENTLSLLNRFFESIWYRAFPLINQGTILGDFMEIFQNSNGKVTARNMEQVQYSRIALIMLLVEYSIQEDEIEDKNLYDVSDKLLNHATSLLFQGNTLKFSTVPTLQALILLRLHKKYNLRDNDGGDGSNGTLLHSLCINMAINMGFHRSIDSLYAAESLTARRTIKKIWLFLLHIDALNSVDIGIPLHIHDDYFNDTIFEEQNYMPIDFIKTIRFCAAKLSKLEVVVGDLLSCIQILKKFIRSASSQSILQDFYANSLETCDAEKYKDIVVRFFNILPLFSILLNCYQIVCLDRENFRDESTMKRFQYSVTRYNMLILVSLGGFLLSLRRTFKISIRSLWSQIFLLGIGASKQVCIRPLISCVQSMTRFTNLQLEGKTYDLKMSNVLSSSNPEEEIIERTTCSLNDPMVLNKGIVFFLRGAVDTPKVLSKHADDYAISILDFGYSIFVEAYTKKFEQFKDIKESISMDFEGYFNIPSSEECNLSISNREEDPLILMESIQWTSDHVLDQWDDYFLYDLF
ncbi:uncharacterized protein PRCAT00004319001 [Priceomyces carsonii]|uniref:uncharacterized protein n=1 Tax=Priceomyces carsonii TaxID=28549 RepID=UPI002EDB46A9|nr:unnamed protein product [Priceomyces carsonii]